MQRQQWLYACVYMGTPPPPTLSPWRCIAMEMTSHPVEVLDDATGEVSLQLDDYLDQLVEVVGTDTHHSQHPGESPGGGKMTLNAQNQREREKPHLLWEL